ncbi:MAG: ABC transporter ATP-binding protein [Magnetospirillum sp.]|nr:ABC transporter ATP-binding protein [Magnetospirillum sp.]
MVPPVVMELDGVACGYRGRTILAGIHLSVRQGDFLCLLGPNGVGKTTLFKTILRLLPAKTGTIRIHGANIARWPVARLAGAIGYVPQAHTPPFPFSVLDVVSMGRAAHLGPFAQPSRSDMALAGQALDSLSIGHLAERAYTEISGGERQLALIARALTQQPSLLVMDEPTSNLDYGNQVGVLDHVRDLTRRTGIAVIMTSHDPNHALCYASRVACLDRSGGLAVGAPADMVTEAYLRDTYGVRTRLVAVEGDGRLCLPLGREDRPCAAC